MSDLGLPADQWLLLAQRERRDADHEYEQAMTYAIEQGLSNVKIAKILDISEAAVRQYRKRRGIK